MRRAIWVTGIACAAAVGNAAVAAQALPSVESLLHTPAIRIGGSVDGPVETLFAGIVGIVRLPDGRLAIADGGNHVIQVFGPDGTHVLSIGREGSGPAEFRGLWWLGSCPSVGLIAVDAIQGRGELFSLDDLRHLRTVQLPPWLLFNEYLSCADGNELTVLVHQPTELGEKGVVTRFPASVERFGLQSGIRQSLFTLLGTEYYFAVEAGGYSPLPLGSRPYAAASPQIVYAGQNKESSAHWVDQQTGQRGTIDHGLPITAVSADTWELAKANVIDSYPLLRTRKLVAEVLRETSAPARGPMYDGIAVDDSARVWLRIPTATDIADWRVINRTGRHVLTVSLPATVHPVVITAETLVGIDRDSLGVQSVVVVPRRRQ